MSAKEKAKRGAKGKWKKGGKGKRNEEMLLLAAKAGDLADVRRLLSEGASGDAKVGRVLHEKGGDLDDENKLDEAMAVYEEALRIRRSALGPEAKEVGDTLNNMGVVLEKQGKLDEAMARYEEALGI